MIDPGSTPNADPETTPDPGAPAESVTRKPDVLLWVGLILWVSLMVFFYLSR